MKKELDNSRGQHVYTFFTIEKKGVQFLTPIIILSILGGLIFLLLFSGTSLKPIKFLGQTVVKILIGALLLFFLNVAGKNYGIHVPINFATSSVSGFLGIPGLIALAAIEKWIILS